MASFARLSEIRVEEIQFLWSGRIPIGGVTILEGDPGGGKSAVALDLAARLTAGLPMPFSTESVERRGVVLIGAEDHVAARIRPAMEAAGADLNHVAVLEKSSGFSLPGNVPNLESAVADVDAGMVLIDPIAAFLGGSMNNDQSVRRCLGPVVALAEKKNIAVVIIRHLTKARGNRLLARGAGSIGIIGLARSCLSVNSPPASEDKFEHFIALTKSNLADAPLAYYRTTKTKSGAIGIEWIRQAKESSHLSDERQAGYVLYSILCDGPVVATRVTRLAKAGAGISARAIEQAKKNLNIESRRIGSGQGSYWILELPRDRRHLMGYKKLAISDLCAELIHGREFRPSEFSDPESLLGDDENEDDR